MASGLRYVCTPPRLGDASPSYSPSSSTSPKQHVPRSNTISSVHHQPSSSSTSSTADALTRSATFSVPSTSAYRGTPPILKFRERSNHRSGFLKRKNSFSNKDREDKKRPKKGDPPIVLPTRFLLGGNISDPLNLASCSGGTPQDTPKSSPLPTPKHKKEVEVLIPENPQDPLNLNGPSPNPDVVSPHKKHHRRNKNRKRKRTDSETTIDEELVPSDGKQPEKSSIEIPTITCEDVDCLSSSLTTGTTSTSAVIASSSTTPGVSVDQFKNTLTEELSDILKRHEREKIVSPVLPQGSHHWRQNHQSHHFNIHKHNLFGHHHQQPGYWKWKKQKNKNDRNANKSYRPKAELYRYGNYDRYYGSGYRQVEGIESDIRLSIMKEEWFSGKDVLDIGCNVGNVTIAIAKDFNPRVMIGVDLDGKLIKTARKNVRSWSQKLISTSKDQTTQFPVSLPVCRGPIVPTEVTASVPLVSTELPTTSTPKFPENIFFIESNYVLRSDDELEEVIPEYDTILCLSVTKWVHLNWGDDGIMRLFKRAFRQLRPGGRFILESQGWPSYVKKKGITPETKANFESIRLRPEKFIEYLLSQEVGFVSSELIGTPQHPSKGFQRPIYILSKGSPSPSNNLEGDGT